MKPANILLRRGEPLVADFGIALAVSTAGGGRITETGLSLGTPHYMSPEQAAGERSLDPRSDVYALGCVLFEMLTGEPPHAGPTGQAVLAKILTDHPRPVTELRRSVPRNVEAAVAHALEKLPADRLASASEFVEALEDPGYRHGQGLGAEGGETAGASVRFWKTSAAALAVVTVALSAWLAFGPRPPAPETRVFKAPLLLPGGQEVMTARFGSSVALSPDGSRLVYTGSSDDEPWQLWIRPADELEATPLPGTAASWSPVFSPDGSSLAVVDPSSKLQVLDLQRGSVRTLADSVVLILDWTRNGHLFYYRTLVQDEVWRVDESGGEPRRMGASEGSPLPPGFFWGGSILPGGEGLVADWAPAGGTPTTVVAALDFATGEVKELVQGSDPRYHERGYLLWGTPEGTLMAAPFDPESLAVTGPAVAMARGVIRDAYGTMQYTLSESGSMVYRVARGSGRAGGLVWVDRQGGMEPASDLSVGLSVGLWEAVRLSPDGDRVALSIAEGTVTQLWIQSVVRDAPPRRITFNGTLNVRPWWTPDGESVVFVTNMAGAGVPSQLWIQTVDGTGRPEPLVVSDREVEEGQMSPDGEWLVYRVGGTSANRDIYAMRPEVDSVGRPLVATEANERAMSISPDGRWLAYVSDDTGRDEVFVSPFPDVSAGRWQISTGGGHSPVWGHDGSEMFYVGAPSTMMAVRYQAAGQSFDVIDVERLFDTTGLLLGPQHPAYSLAPDDGRFLMLSLENAIGDLVWVHNWIHELERMTGTARE